jgi:hypothetical protein
MIETVHRVWLFAGKLAIRTFLSDVLPPLLTFGLTKQFFDELRWACGRSNYVLQLRFRLNLHAVL